MAGRPMKEYVALPDAWRDEPARIAEWMEHALNSVAQLPVKEKGGSATTKRKR